MAAMIIWRSKLSLPGMLLLQLETKWVLEKNQVGVIKKKIVIQKSISYAAFSLLCLFWHLKFI